MEQWLQQLISSDDGDRNQAAATPATNPQRRQRHYKINNSNYNFPMTMVFSGEHEAVFRRDKGKVVAAYHLGLCTNEAPVGGCLRDFGRHYEMEPWDMVEEYLGARSPPVHDERRVVFAIRLR
ncbi:hypothetical protein PIB30_102198 [Stylosanthes scabra]|uniref:Uncharacterized protein n=1 Tax=Stylosanthes scabra TaxID=79078 RepID=A0ABU6QYE6_9FABA|nr:hypothetical protein [Stylosanthes scabra]